MSEPPQESKPPETGTPAWSTYQPDSDKSELPPTHVPYGSSTETSSSVFSTGVSSSLASSRGRLRLIGTIVPVVLFAIGGGYALQQLSDNVDSVTSPFGNGSPANVPDGVPPPDVLSPGGFDDLLGAIEQETGSTKVFQAVIYPDYASLDLPVDASSQRESSWFYDGGMRENGIKGTSSSKRFDLAAVDPAVLTRLVRKTRALVDDPKSSYVIIGGPFSEQPQIRAYSSNEFNESGYITAELNGKIIDRSTS